MNENKEVLNILVEDIIPNRFQPRLSFDEGKLNELANSIKQHGVLQPLLLRKIGNKFEIIAGERRYKASCIAGLSSVPAIIMETDDNTSAEIAIIENIQRKDLSAIEEAKSYKKLIDKGKTQEEIAKKLGIAQSTVANKVRLLSLSDEVQDALLNNRISERHARSLLKLDNNAKQISLLNKIINEKLTVKQTDEEINKILNIINIDSSNNEIKMPEIKEVTEEIELFEEPEEITNIIEIKEETEELNPFVEYNIPVEKAYNPQSKYVETINKVRDFSKTLEKEGNNLSFEEYDLENEYEIVIKIKRDK